MVNTSIVTAYNMFADRKEKKIVGLLVFNIVPDYVVYSFQCQFENENENKNKNNIIQ